MAKPDKFGWSYCIQNFYLIEQAVIKAGVRRGHQDFADFVSMGKIYFIEFYQRWERPLKTEGDLECFDKMVFKHIKDRTIDVLRHINLGGIKQDIENMELPMQKDQEKLVEIQDMINRHCTPREIEVFKAKINGYKVYEIARIMGLSSARVSQIIRNARRRIDNMQ